jgi:hypothetical protein
MTRNLFLIVVSMFSAAFALNWSDSYESGLSKAKSSGSPLLVYFFNENDQKSEVFEKIITEGRLDFMEEYFIFTKIDIADSNNAAIITKYNIRQIPFFALQDFDPKRSERMEEATGFNALNIFKALYEIYTNVSTGFISIADYETAYGSLKLLENFPENMGVEIKKTMKLIEPKLKNKTALKKNDDNAFKADSYMKTAENNLKLSNFNKAYLYFSKVIELAPGTDLAKKAEIEKNKIKDKVDKSVILNKTDKK